MPSRRAQAAFEPIAPSLDLKQLVESQPNFEWAIRINCDMIDKHGLDNFERLVLIHVIIGGKPMVVDNYDTRLDRWTFAVQWLRDNWGSKVVDARDLTADKNVPLTVQHYLKHMALLTNQWDDRNYKDKERQRMYLKDIDCPDIWADKVKDHVPFGMFYMNDSTGDFGGFGAVDESERTNTALREGRGIAKAGDLMSSLPEEMRAQNLMCYIGHEGTYTPSHREMCACLGQNIMVEASTSTIEDGKLTKPGSSIWFMTETKERDVVSEYWLSRLGHDIEIEKHFAQVNAWKQAPFKVYVVEQKPGDLILIPPLAPHQVWNRGTRTMKVAWNRTTVETLEMAMNEALPKARMVCRDEQYKIKAIIFFTLQKYSKQLKTANELKKVSIQPGQSDDKVRQLAKDFKRLQALFTRIMVAESFLPDKQEKKIDFVPYDSNITCSYCRCNIFNRFLTCGSCVGKLPDGGDDTYDICMDCYAMGRSCGCISKLTWVEQWKRAELEEKHSQWRRQIIDIEGKVDNKSPKPLKTELNLLGKKRTLAQVCQLELMRRPFNDISKPAAALKLDDGVERDEIDEVDADGNVKKKKKVRRSEKYVREHGRCHVDCYWEPKWKQAQCSKCDKNYCYGNLYRAYDMMPQDVMADPDWKCPSCRKLCGCRHCRHKPGFKQYTPQGTMLGHNTKAVADPRSVESLVDFSFSNIAWIQKAGDDHEEDTRRMRRRLHEAEVAKAKDPALIGENYIDDQTQQSEDVEDRLLQLAEQEGIPIDPTLGAIDPALGAMNIVGLEDEDAIVEHPEGGPHMMNAAPEEDANPHFLLPEGGVIWDNEHAYDQTDAITYVYPDLNENRQLPPAPVEGYTAIIPGYEESTAQNGDDKIEMVDRKRKRAKVDEGDQAYMHKKAYKPTSKARKSLVVKFAISREKLAEINKTATIAKQAIEVTAPLIGSDLQALNVEHHPSEVQAPQKRARIDIVDVDGDGNDDEFTPGRYRDRRKPAVDGLARPDPDADITRRTTRMQAVTYAEPDEEEFGESVVPRGSSSKLATMEKAIHDASNVAPLNGTGDNSESNAQRISEKPEAAPVAQKLTEVRDVIVKSKPMASMGEHRAALSAVKLNDAPIDARFSPDALSRPSTSSSATSIHMPTKVIAQAQANRRAKMAAIEGAGTESDDLSDEWSRETDVDRGSTSKTINPQLLERSDQSTHRTTGGKAPRFSLPTTNFLRDATPPPKALVKSFSAVKVSAADWGDDSSDDDIQPSKALPTKSSSGFVAVNTNVHRTNHIPPPVRGGLTKRRGRPPKAFMR